MAQTDNEQLQPKPLKRRLRHTFGYSMSALTMAGFNLLVWICLLLPTYLVKDVSTNSLTEGLGFFLSIFMVSSIGGLFLAVTAMIKSRFKKEMAYYGLLANLMMIGLNLSLLIN